MSLSAIQAEESGVCLGKSLYTDSECFVCGFAAVFKGDRGKCVVLLWRVDGENVVVCVVNMVFRTRF
jgi:hypothetical protein